LVFEDVLARISSGAFSIWYPISVIAPFLAYEIAVVFGLSRWEAWRGRLPRPIRFANALVETSLPTVIIIVSSSLVGTAAGFGIWPLLYFVYIVASALRLEFALPVFTGVVAGVEYLAAAAWMMPLSLATEDPLLAPPFHVGKALILVFGGVVAGLVSVRLRRTLVRVLEESAVRER